MSVGIYIDKEHKMSELDIYAYVEIGDEPGLITKLEDGLTPVLHGTKLRISYDPACQDQIVGRVESYLHPHEGGRFIFEQPENDMSEKTEYRNYDKCYQNSPESDPFDDLLICIPNHC